MNCPRSGCALPATLPSEAYDASSREHLKTCPRCRLSFWVPAEQCIIGRNGGLAYVAPISPEMFQAVCKEAASDVGHFWLHPVDYADVRKFGRDILDVETRTEHITQGRLSSIKFGTRRIYLWVRKTLPKGLIYATSTRVELPNDWAPGTYDQDPWILAITRA